jgi:hypothetical protein
MIMLSEKDKKAILEIMKVLAVMFISSVVLAYLLSKVLYRFSVRFV